MKPVARILCSLLSWPLWPDIEISNPLRPPGKKAGNISSLALSVWEWEYPRHTLPTQKKAFSSNNYSIPQEINLTNVHLGLLLKIKTLQWFCTSGRTLSSRDISAVQCSWVAMWFFGEFVLVPIPHKLKYLWLNIFIVHFADLNMSPK